MITQKHKELVVTFVDVLNEFVDGLTCDEIKELVSEELLKRNDYNVMDGFLTTFNYGTNIIKKNIEEK